MILLPIMALLGIARANDNKPADAYYVGGQFYSNIRMRLSCNFFRRDATIAKASLTVRSVSTQSSPNDVAPPAVEVDIVTTEKLPITAGKFNGYMSFNLPMNSFVMIKLPVGGGVPLNQRYATLQESFDFPSNKTFYVAAIGGTREDLASSEAVGYCSIDAVEGNLQKGLPK